MAIKETVCRTPVSQKTLPRREDILVVAKATRKVLQANARLQRFFILEPRNCVTARARKKFAEAVLSQRFLVPEHQEVGTPRASSIGSATMCLQVVPGREILHRSAGAA